MDFVSEDVVEQTKQVWKSLSCNLYSKSLHNSWMPVAWMTVALSKATKTQFKMALHFLFSHKYLESSLWIGAQAPWVWNLSKLFMSIFTGLLECGTYSDR